MITTKIAFRNIFRQRRRSLLTGLTMTGGLVLLSLTLSLHEGSYGGMIEAFTGSYTGHAQIHKEGYLEKPSLFKTFTEAEKIGAEIEKIKGVKSWTPRLFTPALAFADQKTTAARIIGIDPSRERKTTTIAEKVEEGAFIPEEPSNEVMIGGGLAEILKLKPGDEIVFIAQAADGSVANDIFKVSAVLKGGNDSNDRINCYMHIETAQEYLTLEGRFHEIAVMLKDYSMAAKTSVVMNARLKEIGLEVSPWQVIEADFYKTMVLDKQYSYIMLLVIVVIVALGVLNTALMSILERTREFGVLKALGARPRAVFWMIIQETTFLSLLSIALGLVLSFFVNYYFTVYGIEYPEPVDVAGYKFSSVNAELGIGCFLWPTLVTLGSAVLASLWPAALAYKTSPTDAMRTN